MVAKKSRRKQDNNRVTAVAIALSVFLVIVFFGGQLTGLATEFNGTLTITVAEVESCTSTVAGSAWSGNEAFAITAPAGQTTTDDDPIRFTNAGNSEMDVNLTLSDTHGYLSDSSVTLNSVSMTSAANYKIWDGVAPAAQTAADKDFAAVTHATEAAAAYTLPLNFTCDFSPT